MRVLARARRFAVSAFAALALSALAPAAADAFRVYVSNSDDYVTVYGAGANGALTPIACDPTTVCKTGDNPAGIAIDPAGRHVYVANTNAPHSVSVFSIGPTGALTPVACDPTTACKADTNPVSIAIDPAGRHLYTANSAADSVSVFSIEANGALTPVTCNPTTDCKTGDGPTGVAIDPAGDHLYTTNRNTGDISAFTIGPTGALTPISCDPATTCNTGGEPTGITIDPSGRHIFVGNGASTFVSVFSIGPGGVPAPVTCDPATSCKTGGGPFFLAASPRGGRLFVANYLDDSMSVFTFGASGVLSPVTCDPATSCKTGDSPDGIGVDPSGRFVYTANNNSNSVSVLAVQPSGALTPVACDPATNCKAPGVPDFWSLAVTPDRGPAAAFSVAGRRAGSKSRFDGGASPSPDYPITRYAWNFGDGKTAVTTGPVVRHTYARRGKYTATLTVTDAAGCSRARVFTGQTMSCNGSAKARRTRTVTVRAALARLRNLRVKPRAFVAGRRAFIRFTSSRPATTTFTVQRKRRGRKGFRNVGSFKRKHAAGKVRIRFRGRVRGRRLAPGRYRLRAVPRNAGGKGRAVFAKFRVKRATRGR